MKLPNYIIGPGTFHNHGERFVYVEAGTDEPEGPDATPGFAFCVAECDTVALASALVSILNTLDATSLEYLRREVNETD